MFKNIKEESTFFLFRKMWKFSDDNHFKVVLFLILSTIACILELVEPLIFAKLINEIQFNGIKAENINFLFLISISFIVLTVTTWVFHGISRVIERKNAFLVRKKYKEFLLKKVLNSDLNWHNNRDSGDTIDKVNKASSAIYNFSETIFRMVQIVVQMIGTSFVLIYFNWKIGIFILIGAFLIIFTSNKFNKKLIKQYKKLNEFENKIEAKVFDSISNVTSIIILNIKENILKNIAENINRPYKLFKKNIVLNELKWFLTDSLFKIFIIVLPLFFYIYNLYLKNSSNIEIGTITALYAYLRGLGGVFFGFAWAYEEIIKRKTSVLNAESIEFNSVEDEEKKQKRKNIQNWNDLKIKNLKFSYQENENKLSLNNINFELKLGEKVALIGESGSGKTTFLKVFHGLYENARAEMKIDNKEIFKTNFADLNLQTMLVPQEPELFSSSIRENITFGLDCSDEEIKQFTDLAQFSEVAEKLPKKFDSIINEKGVNLSGGQKQRLALSRALLFSQDKKIILLDESTSSVDPENEVKIYQNIFEYFKGKTILASIHKINLLKYFDRIVIFQDGEIVDFGTFDKLLEKNEKFRNDWEEYVRKN